MTFSTLIIGVAFLPLFTMTGVSGVIFAPMAKTYAFAIGGAILLALTLTPVVASKVIPAQSEEKDSYVMRALISVYNPMFDRGRQVRERGAPLALVPILMTALLFPLLGREFMPKLEEGNFWIRATLAAVDLARPVGEIRRPDAVDPARLPDGPGTPCDEAHRKHPEIIAVVSQLGRPDDGTDVSGFSNIELFAPLKSFDEWPRGMTKEKLTDELNKELSEAFPGAIFNFSQMISDNVEEAVSGVKGENSVKVFGTDLDSNEKIADAIVDVMGKVPGIKDLGHVPVDGAAEHQDHAEARRVRALRAQHGRRGRGDPGGHRRAGAERRSTRARSASTSRCAGSPSTE